MKISDGTTELTFDFADETWTPGIDKTTRFSSGGAAKSQTAGERLPFAVRMRSTPAALRVLIDLLKNGSNEYYYDPELSYRPLFPGVTFPIKSNITITGNGFDNRSQYYIDISVQSAEYL